MEENGKTRESLVFAVNGERFELSTIDPSTTLLEFLRTQTRYKSAKLGCGEGGCGACVVLLSKYDSVHEQVEDLTVSSCLTPLCSVNGCSITTSEGIGNSKDGFHPVHKRFAGFHASQCGFCTPGFCTSFFGALVNAEKSNRPEPPSGFSKLTVFEAEKAIAGNLCRCTGYRPIADACKSFSAEVDMEDLGLNSFWRKGESREVKISRLPSYNQDHKICTFPEFLKKENKCSVLLGSEKHCWYSPGNLEELQSILEMSKDNGTGMKLVVSNTGTGYYKDTEIYEKYIDLRDDFLPKDEVVLKSIADHMEKIASGFIRNTASIGGNLVMAQRHSFPSDIATILLAANSVVDLMTGSRFERITLDEFFDRPPMDSESVLLRIKIPSWESSKILSSECKSKLLFETYRAAPRPLGNALPYMNAAFLAEVSPCKVSGGIIIDNCRLTFGAYGTKHAIRARKVEEFLVGKLLSISVLYEAVTQLKATVVPEDGTSSSAYRSSLASGFLFEFFRPLTDSSAEKLKGQFNGLFSKSSDMKRKHEQFHYGNYPSLLSSGKQVIQSSTDYFPVGEPISKSGAAIQASGEAVYVDDIPSPTNCLHGTFIYSTKPLARVKKISFKQKSQAYDVTAVLSSKDIPKGGENIGSKTIFGTEPLFADGITRCAGERLAFVIADTQKHADMVANSAVIDYDMENLESPILSVEEAVKRSSLFEVPPTWYPKQVGDIEKGLAEANHKILSAEIKLGSQYYFYMETQSALAMPDEENSVVVYLSSQCPEYAHSTVAACLGIPEHNVRIITRRVGGGFGGKYTRSNAVAAACALAAQKLHRPVRIYLNRKTDMIMAGGRHPMKITYSVGFKSNGKITALQLEILINAGIYEDISAIMPNTIVSAFKKYDWGVLSFDVKVCKTNHSSKSAMRAPGEVQGSFIAEAVMEHVASILSMEVDSVRNINLHTYESLSLFYEGSEGELLEYTLPSIWNKIAISASFIHRTEMVKAFNRINIWKKRGISRVPIVHEVPLRPTSGKVKQMAAYALSAIQCDDIGDLLDKVRVVQCDTLSLVQGGETSGSTTSESSCEAVRLCCNILVERLTLLKENLQGQLGSLKWETLILQAYSQAVHLSASSLFVPDSTDSHYLNYGTAVSEVEVNLLTGETTILQVDIIYDCGQSLNPAMDLGQIEGAFVQGIGFFMLEEYPTNSDGLVVAEGTWTYKIPSIDTIPKQFNVEILNSGHHQKRVLSSKASGEPPLLLAVSIHCAAREAIREARKQLLSWSTLDGPESTFQLDVPAIMPVVKELCGLDIVERYLEWKLGKKQASVVC
ncbi:putative Aldehyde oxidase [Quillaja saponaria]|uniref:indole-3-acetaldehyde oxidase n=1 Tax=Quillaja saponaria TaxID=32244 RepID=A0AAD7LLU2_QUISA|nr:putative Aldehyde oxidase [Quillaja saponaria]